MPTYSRGDQGIPLDLTVYNPDGTIADITGATVKFKMRSTIGTTLKVDAVCTIDDGPNGKCSYTLIAADLDTAGSFIAELEVTFSGGNPIQTAPLEPFRIIPDLP